MHNKIANILLLDTLGTLFCENSCSQKSRQKIAYRNQGGRQHVFTL